MPMLRLLCAKQEMADTILVNSQFTRGIFKDAFPSISQEPRVLYPSVNLDAYDGTVVEDASDDVMRFLKRFSFFFGKNNGTYSHFFVFGINSSDTTKILSINRFERKKNIELALRAFDAVFRVGRHTDKKSLQLIVAGENMTVSLVIIVLNSNSDRWL